VTRTARLKCGRRCVDVSSDPDGGLNSRLPEIPRLTPLSPPSPRRCPGPVHRIARWSEQRLRSRLGRDLRRACYRATKCVSIETDANMINLKKLKAASEGKEQPSWFSIFFDRSLKEALLLDKASEFFEPEPCRLFQSEEDGKRVNEKLATLYAKLGGVPNLFITRKGVKPSDTYDDFSWYSVQEMVSLFDRARLSVSKVHAKFITYEILRGGKRVINTGLTKKQLTAFEPIVIEEFWESAETAYIRLASMWDRVGQLLDYVFFNIRQFERDGSLPSSTGSKSISLSWINRWRNNSSG
jgi:hypothetical protein